MNSERLNTEEDMKQQKTSNNTLQGIAEALQRSPATLSRVRNNHPHGHKATRTKVLAMVAQTGYRRNIMASGWRPNKTPAIGFIVPRVSMFVPAEIITTIQNSLQGHGYKLIICRSNNLLAVEKERTPTLYASHVGAVTAACTLYTQAFSHFDRWVQHHLPVFPVLSGHSARSHRCSACGHAGAAYSAHVHLKTHMKLCKNDI